MSETTDIDLSIAGDTDAFRRLYDRHGRAVYGQIIRLTADRATADDLLQEVFVQAWKSLAKFNQQAKFSTWLYSLTNNVCITELRKQSRWFKRNQRALEVQQQQNPLAESNELDLSDLDRLVVRLPEQTRTVFVLHGLNDYSHQQVADLLGIAVGTSKAQFHRARALLQEWL